jgi:hypothetical protein
MRTQTLRFLFLIALVFSLLTSSIIAHATGILYVKPDGTGDCSDWVNACTLQAALNNAVKGDEIWVLAGMYKPTTGTSRDATFQLKDGVAVYGGFVGTETARDQRDPTTNVTKLSGNIGTDGDGDNSYHVVTGATGATLDGFTIVAGNASNLSSGGGMYNYNSSPTLNNVIFGGNSAAFTGGAMSNVSSNPVLTNVTFRNNLAPLGGGIVNNDSSPTLMNVTFYHNIGSSGAGGMYNVNSVPVLTNVTFRDNWTAGYGGGMYNYNSGDPELTNVTFIGNSAELGGAMYNLWSSNPLLTNVSFSDNSANQGSAMYNEDSSDPQIRNTIFWGNTATITDGMQIYNENSTPTVSDSVVQDGYAGGTNIITTDPKLGSLGNYGGSTLTVPLLAGSSAINMGNDATCATADQRGVPRPQGTHCDIGAYEYDSPFVIAIDDSFTVLEDASLVVASPGVLSNDLSLSNLTVMLDITPTNGTLSFNIDGSFQYTPTSNFNGVDGFTYVASDGVLTDTAVVTTTVIAVNDAPIAVEDRYTTTAGITFTALAPGVLGNDTDIEGDSLIAVLDAPAMIGSLILNSNGSFVYTPRVGYIGADSFTYHANDGSAGSNQTTVQVMVIKPTLVYLPIVSR